MTERGEKQKVIMQKAAEQLTAVLKGTRNSKDQAMLAFSVALGAALAAVDTLYKTEVVTLQARIAGLEAELEARAFQGEHEDSKRYERFAMVTKHGCLWIATCPTYATPGGKSTDWALAAKKGRDYPRSRYRDGDAA